MQRRYDGGPLPSWWYEDTPLGIASMNIASMNIASWQSVLLHATQRPVRRRQQRSR